MSYNRRNIAVYANELTFIKSFINALTAADSRITCPTDNLDEQFSSTSSVPRFSLVLDGVLTLTFTRNTALASISSYYACTDHKGRIGSLPIPFSYDTYAPGTNATRIWQTRIVSNSKLLRLDIGSYSADMAQPTVSVMVLRDGGMSGSAVSTISSSVTRPVIAQNICLSDDTQIVKRDRLSYVYQTDSASDKEVIHGKVFVTPSDAVRVLEVAELHDISTVAANTVVTIGGKTYYSLDNHTLMEI